LPFPIHDQGQPLFSPESTSSHTDHVPIDEDSEEAIFVFRKRDHQQSRAMASCTLLFPLAFLILLPFPLLGARTRLLPSRLPALMMAFFPLLTSPLVFLPFLPSGARALSPRARVRLNRLLLRPLLVGHPRPLGRIPFPFLPYHLPSFSIFSSSISCPRVSSYSFPPPTIPAYASCVTSLSSSSPSSSRTMFCAMFIPKLFLRLLWFFRRTAALFRQIRTFPQLFRFCHKWVVLQELLL